MDFCIYDDIFNMIQMTDKKLLHFKLSKSGQFLRVDKTCFPRPSHIFTLTFDHEYKFALTFDLVTTLDHFDLGVERIKFIAYCRPNAAVERNHS